MILWLHQEHVHSRSREQVWVKAQRQEQGEARTWRHGGWCVEGKIKVTNVTQFAWDSPGFSSQSPASWKPPQCWRSAHRDASSLWPQFPELSSHHLGHHLSRAPQIWAPHHHTVTQFTPSWDTEYIPDTPKMSPSAHWYWKSPWWETWGPMP